MTLNILAPREGPVGPGIRSWTQWIPEYTVPPGSAWNISIIDFLGPPEQLALRHRYPNASTELGVPFFLIGDPTAGTLEFPANNVRAGQGDPVTYRIALSSGLDATILDQAEIGTTWDASWSFRLNPTTTGTGGFTSIDRDTLNTALAAVRTVLPAAVPGGAQLVMQAIDLVRGPPRAFLQPFGSQLLSGRGTLSAQPPGALHSFGGTWSWFTLPAGYGKDDGALVEWHRRLAQFVVIREGAGDNTYIDVLEDSHWEGNFILWQFPNPTEIQYDIAPGVQVLWRWLV